VDVDAFCAPGGYRGDDKDIDDLAVVADNFRHHGPVG
jgi:hypothetical protein